MIGERKFKMFKLRKIIKPDKIRTNENGKEVLTKTEDFQLYAIRNNDDEILGTILLTDAQVQILNGSVNKAGIKFTKQ